MTHKLIQELQLRLKAPLIALERIAKDQHLPMIFAEAAAEELIKVQKLVDELGRKNKK